MRRIHHDQHQVGIRKRLHRFLNTDGLGFVERLANARRIHQFHRNAANRDRLADQIAGGARSRSDDGAFALDEPVE